MSKYIAILVAILAVIFTTNAMAFSPPPAPANGFYVYDGTGKLSATQVSALNQKILRVSKATNNEFGIAFLQSLDGAAIEDAANATFRAWGIGKHGLDNGVLIMLSLKEHKSRIETGKGVGGEITDLQSKQILDGLRPALRSNDFYGAFNQALDQTSALLDSRSGAKQQLTPMVGATPAQQEAANRLAQQQGAPLPYPSAVPTAFQPNNPSVPGVQQSSGLGGFTTFLGILVALVVVGGIIYFLVARSNQRQEEEEREYRRRAEARRREEEYQLQREMDAIRHSVPSPFVPPTTHHTTSQVASKPAVPLTPTYENPFIPVQNQSAVSSSSNVDSVAEAVAATFALDDLRRREEEERERREEARVREREREREEERARARRREAEAEEERRAEARAREREAQQSSYTPSYSAPDTSSDSSSSWGTSDSGGGFGGGDSGGGGSSSDW